LGIEFRGISQLPREIQMTKINPKSGITRRGFFQRGAGLLATAGILAGVSEEKEALDDKKVDVARTALRR
jgi:hypothetical protein